MDREIEDLEPGLNILIGDNDTGKSTVLLALDLVMRASTSQVQGLGLEKLMNNAVVQTFLSKKGRNFGDLPKMEIDLYLSDVAKHEYYGEFNSKRAKDYGICLICQPRDELADVINEVVAEEGVFPFEYYSIEFKTFNGAPYVPFRRILEHVSIDNTKISSETASRSYVKDMYKANVKDGEQSSHQIKYRQAKSSFTRENLGELNKRLEADISFALRNDSKANLETDLTIRHQDIDIDSIGMGNQCFIRTSFALSKKVDIDVVLLEEPENHLSQRNMKRLIDQISQVTKSQVFIATHSSYICSRLDLRKAIMFGAPSGKPLRLSHIPEDTAEFFMKAPQNSLLEFILSPRTLLVEGDAEYILLASLYKNVTGKELNDGAVSVISVGGIRFPRYLDVATVLGNKVAVVTDNDKKLDSPRLERYRSYEKPDKIKVFYDASDERHTFEVCMYQDNKILCDATFAEGRKKLTVPEYMIANKSEAAFHLSKNSPDKLIAPGYLKDAITWISA